jgi:hypothetical protein
MPDAGDCGGGELCFPKRGFKGTTTSASKAVCRLEPGEIEEVLDELAGRITITQVRNPIGYCAAEPTRARRMSFPK